MIVEKHKVVTLDYVLKDDSGNVIDQAQDGNFAYLHGANNIIPGLENALAGKTAGDALSVTIEPEQGYGQRDDSMSQVVNRSMFHPDDPIELGKQYHAQSPDGQTIVITITDIAGDDITIDGNHPLAGVNLNFDVTVVNVREASNEEIQHGHVHGPEGHHHD